MFIESTEMTTFWNALTAATKMWNFCTREYSSKIPNRCSLIFFFFNNCLRLLEWWQRQLQDHSGGCPGARGGSYLVAVVMQSRKRKPKHQVKIHYKCQTCARITFSLRYDWDKDFKIRVRSFSTSFTLITIYNTSYFFTMYSTVLLIVDPFQWEIFTHSVKVKVKLSLCLTD
jgi:hypothetical protein